MRIFKDAFGYEVDLDDPKTFDYLPNDIKILDDRMFKNIGQAILYMDYFQKGHYPNDSTQRLRIMDLIQIFAQFRKDNWENLMWFKEQCFIFEDETENMC